MSAPNLVCARRFLEALAAAAMTGNKSLIYPLLTQDVEWVTPMRSLNGIDQVQAELTWLSPHEKLDFDFEEVETTDRGDGRVVSNFRQIYRMKGTGDFAYARERRIDLTIRDGKIASYEMHVVG